MTKLQEILNKIEVLKTTAQNYLDNGDNENARKTMDDIKSLKEQAEIQKALDGYEKDDIMHREKQREQHEATDIKEQASFIRAALKKVTGVKLTEKENALLMPTTSEPNGANGEGYILPQDIQTKINKRIREYKSFREVLGIMKTTSTSGSYPVEDFETVSELVDFTDGEDGQMSNDIRFKNISYKLSEKAGFIKLSNTLMEFTDNDLIEYIVEIFAKKAVITENKMAIACLKSNKTVKTLPTWNALKSSINRELDPAVLYGTVIVTNQDGFDFLDSQLDTTGRPILNLDPKNDTQKKFKGYPIIVFSNDMLPSSDATSTKDGYAPIFYGNIKEAVKFVEYKHRKFATSSEAGFLSNTTYARVIEYITTVQHDASDKCYIYGQLKIADKTGS